MSEGLQGAVEAKLALTEVAFQSNDKLTAKNLSEHRNGKKEARMRWNPMRVIERQSAGGHHTMGVWVMFEFLIPGVKHAKEADLGAEMFGIASDFEEGFGTNLEQEVVQDLLVLQGERCQLMGQGEDNMNVTRRQKFLATCLEPTVASVGLTGSKILLLMPASLQVRLGSQGFGVSGSFARSELASPFQRLWGRVPHSERRCAK